MKSAFTITWAAPCLFVLALTVVPAAYGAHPNPDLVQVHNVYLLPMSQGFDQYLANHLAQTGRFRVVTDPKLADAILTDTIGAAFDARYSELYPPPSAPKEVKKSEGGEEKPHQTKLEAARETIEQNAREEKQLRTSTFVGRSRGNLFLVVRPSRTVIWSQYKRPRNTRPDELDKLAEYFVGQLKKQAGQPVSSAPPGEHEVVVPEPPATAPVSTPAAPDKNAPTAP